MARGHKTVPFNPSKDIPPLTGKVILVTGATVGLGREAVLEFARHNPHLIWLAARNVEKANAIVADIKQQIPSANIKVLELDLASFDSVKKAAATVLADSDRLDILMLNAGVMALPPSLTADGYEIQFGTNHMGHVLLTKLLMPLLLTTADSVGPAAADKVHIVSLSSRAHAMPPRGSFDFDSLKTTADKLGAFGRYYRSKLSNVLWARQFAREYPQFTVAAVHPGIVRTPLWERATGLPAVVRALTRLGQSLMTSVERGVRNQLWAAVSPDVKSGEYYEPIGVLGAVSEDGKDDVLAKRLWDWTEKELEGHVVSEPAIGTSSASPV